MFRRIADFVSSWQTEMDSTLRVLRNLTDESLSQAVVPGGRTLGFLAWHVTGAIGVMLDQFGMSTGGPPRGAPVPQRAADLVSAYERAAGGVLQEVERVWSDDTLTDMVTFFGRSIPAGRALQVLILHQSHHRGQMTVLMRQAGLPVPGVYGPGREEWVAMGREPME